MKKNKEDTEKTRLAILAAAKTVFSQKEYAATTLEEIADTAGMTRGAVYWHFKNKEMLLHYLLDEYEDSLYLEALRILKGFDHTSANLSQRGLVWISLWITSILKERNMFKIRLMYNLQNPDKKSERRKLANQNLMHSVKTFFTPVLHEITHPMKEKALDFIIMTLDTSMAYKLILENMEDVFMTDLTPDYLVREYHLMFNLYLGVRET